MTAAMVRRFLETIGTLLMPLALTSCLLTPGKFVSTLRVDADRHFAFTYVGEVIATDLNDTFAKGLQQGAAARPRPNATSTPGSGTAPPLIQDLRSPAAIKDAEQKRAEAISKVEAKNRAIADVLAKEVGYRKVVYLGGGKFSIDYAISGTLDRGFVWPYNLDAEILFPFLALEVRGNNTVRVKAPAFATENEATKSLGSMTGMGSGSDKLPSQLDGSFTLDTDAEIVSQNQEDGTTTIGTRKRVTWKATPTTRDAPMAVLRFK